MGKIFWGKLLGKYIQSRGSNDSVMDSSQNVEKILKYSPKSCYSARSHLEYAQKASAWDKFNSTLIENERECIEELMKWLELEERLLAQRATIRWLKFRDR